MRIGEIAEAEKELAKLEKTLGRLERDSPFFRATFQKAIEPLIAAKGHAWCMDVKIERKKMARLLSGFIDKFGLPASKN